MEKEKTFDTLLEQMVKQEVEEQVTAALQQHKDFKPWYSVVEIQARIPEFKDRQSVINKFCWNSATKTVPEANMLHLTKKISGRWCFKNPEFFTYLHDVYWKK